MTTLHELAAMLDAATGPSREVNQMISVLFDGMTLGEGMWEGMLVGGNGNFFPTTPYTSSIDAALALVERLLPGWEWSLWRVGETCGATLYNAPDNELEPSIALQAPTAPLAILKALVAALIAQEEADQ